MDKIYLVIKSGGSYEDRWEYIDRAFYTKEKAIEYRDECNEKLRKLKYKEEQKEKRGKFFDYEILYDTNDAKIEEVDIE